MLKKNKNIKNLAIVLPLFILLAMPLMALAAINVVAGDPSIAGLIAKMGGVLTAVVPLLIGFAVVFFLWGVLQFVAAGGNEEKRTEGRNTMIYGIIAIFVMVSVWGLVNVLEGTFNLSDDASNIQDKKLIPNFINN